MRKTTEWESVCDLFRKEHPLRAKGTFSIHSRFAFSEYLCMHDDSAIIVIVECAIENAELFFGCRTFRMDANVFYASPIHENANGKKM